MRESKETIMSENTDSAAEAHNHKWSTSYKTFDHRYDSASGMKCECGAVISQDEVEDLVNTRTPPISQLRWATPKGETARGYNAAIYHAVMTDVFSPSERAQLAKWEKTRSGAYQKTSTWVSQSINDLIHRIMNLRIMLADARASQPQVSAADVAKAKAQAAYNEAIARGMDGG